MDTLATQTVRGDWFKGYSIDGYDDQDMFPGFPNFLDELSLFILSHLDVKELGKVLFVSKKWCVLGSNHAACGDLKKINIFGKNFWNLQFDLVVDEEPPIEIAKQKKALTLVVTGRKEVSSVLIPKGCSITSLGKLIDWEIEVINDRDLSFLDDKVVKSYWVHITGILKESFDPTTNSSIGYHDLKHFFTTLDCEMVKGVEVAAQAIAIFACSGQSIYSSIMTVVLEPNTDRQFGFDTIGSIFEFNSLENDHPETMSCNCKVDSLGAVGVIR